MVLWLWALGAAVTGVTGLGFWSAGQEDAAKKAQANAETAKALKTPITVVGISIIIIGLLYTFKKE